MTALAAEALAEMAPVEVALSAAEHMAVEIQAAKVT